MENEEDKGTRKLYRDRNLLVINSVTLIAVMGVATIAPVFPKLTQELHVTPKAIGLLITVFTIPGVVLTPVLGVLADHFGRKKILIPSLLLFGIAGSACALAQTFDQLLVLRFFQGVGASALGSLNVTLIGDLYSGRERTAAMGYNASVLSVGTASWPAIGGALAMLGWHYPFLLPLVALPVGGFVLFVLKNPEPQEMPPLREYLSGVWQDIRKRQVLALFLVSVVTFIILFGPFLTFFPMLLDGHFGASALVIGLMMSVSSLSSAACSSQLGRLTRITSENNLMKVAFALYALTLVLIPLTKNIWFLLIPCVLFGIAQGLNIPSLMTLLAGMAPMKHRAAFMSINGMVLRLGQSLGPLLAGFIFGIWGMGGTFYAGAGLAIAMFVVLVAAVK